MPEQITMNAPPSNLDDLNLDFSDRNPELRRKKLTWEFSLHDSDSEEETDLDPEVKGQVEGDGLEDDDEGYFFDQGLDFSYDTFNKKRIVGHVKDDTGKAVEVTTDKVKAIPNGHCSKSVYMKNSQDTMDDVIKKVEEISTTARRNDREEIRKKLAMGADDDDDYDDDDDDDISYKKPNLQSRLHSGLQICFMNESPGDTDSEGLSPRQHEIHDNMKLMSKADDIVDSDNNLKSVTDLNKTASGINQDKSSTPPRLKGKTQADQASTSGVFHSRQEQLQEEAKMALAQAGTMARMQLEIEKQTQKKSPMAEMIGIPGLGERRRKKLGVRKLQEMNLTSIQVLYNDLQTQIENLNEELVHLLMERDELHMEQDSMLVDIEDLTRRAEELAEKSNAKSAAKNSKNSKNHVQGKVGGR